ncbi:MAG: YdeI/OmpD-associated family protein [Gemmatimonadota bacterium]
MIASPKTPAPVFFATPALFRAWLERNHEAHSELLVGFYKRDSGRESMTWPESVNEALCFGWIDGVRRRIDDESYSIRFTPRKAVSIWSTVNINKIRELIAANRVHPAGLRALERRSIGKSSVYSYENKDTAVFDAEMEREFKRNRKAWKFFEQCPPWYRRTATWRVVSAKRPETRAKRLAELIACCEAGRAIPSLTLSRDPLEGRMNARAKSKRR